VKKNKNGKIKKVNSIEVMVQHLSDQMVIRNGIKMATFIE